MRPHRSAPHCGARAACVALVAAALVAGACAWNSSPPSSGKSTVRGQLRLVPREGVSPHAAGAAGYADRALRDVRFVDYSRPGFAVVYVDAPSGAPQSARIAIRTTGTSGRLRLQPKHALSGNGGSIIVANESTVAHTVSDPAAGVLRRIASGETFEIPAPASGPHVIHVLDASGLEATVFVSGGPGTVVSERGRFELRELPPGTMTLRAWHPRFPPVERELELAADAVVQADLEMGVGLGGAKTR